MRLIPQRFTALSVIELAKRAAAYQTVDSYIKTGMVVGIGSGSTVVYAVDRLAERVKREKLNIICVPSSFQAQQLVNDRGLVLSDLNRNPKLHVTIDGADEVDFRLDCIKGGGGCQTQEKLLAANTEKLFIIADYTKRSKVLGTAWTKGVPIEVLPQAYRVVMNHISNMKGEAALRMGKAKAGPVVTDNGNFILDAKFGQIRDPNVINNDLRSVVGVVETGLFVQMAHSAIFGEADGSVVHLYRGRSMGRRVIRRRTVSAPTSAAAASGANDTLAHRPVPFAGDIDFDSAPWVSPRGETTTRAVTGSDAAGESKETKGSDGLGDYVDVSIDV